MCVCVGGTSVVMTHTIFFLYSCTEGGKNTSGMTLPVHWKQSELPRLGNSISCERWTVPPRAGRDKRAQPAMNHMLLSPDPEPQPSAG